MKKELFGVIPPIITPLDEQERVDEEGFRKLLNHCVDSGLHAIFVAGTNGESLALTQKERDRAIKIALDEVGDKVPVLCGVMDSSSKRVIENVKRLEDMGGEYAVVTSIFYAKHATQNETVLHFKKIIENTNSKLVIYNIPPFTGQNLTADTVINIAECSDRVVGYKDSSGNIKEFSKCLAKYRGTSFSVLQGTTPAAAASMLMGADGYIPAMAPLFPKAFVSLYEYGKAGNREKTMAWNNVLIESDKILSLAKNQISATKFALHRLGFTNKRTAVPYEPITKDEEKAIDFQIEKVQQMIEYMA